MAADKCDTGLYETALGRPWHQPERGGAEM